MDDQISRNTLLRYVADWQYSEAIVGNEAVYDTIEKFYHMVEEMPSAQPERIKGRWVKMSDADGTYYCCSECGNELYRKYSYNPEFDLFPRKESIDKTNFCMFCGADMRGEEDG